MATTLAATLAIPAAVTGTPFVQAEENVKVDENIATTQLIVKINEDVTNVVATPKQTSRAIETSPTTANIEVINTVQVVEQQDNLALVTMQNEEPVEETIQVVDKKDDVVVIEVEANKMDEVKESLLQFENVEYVEENVIYTIAAMNDEFYESQWNLKSINAEQAWADLNEMELSEDDVVVAVLDTGVQHDHEDLQGRILEGASFVSGEEGKNLIGFDDQGHGTFVSGFIVANADNNVGIAGVAGKNEQVKVLPVKVMNKNGSGTALDIAKGIDYAVSKGVDVINMSLSGEYSETIDQAVQRAAEKGIVVVSASGNGGGNADVSYPAALDNVISVAALATNDQHYTRSNVGETVDLSAPGAGVLSTTMAAEKYITGSGTSYATPHVAAAAALYKLKYPNASAKEIEDVLKATAKDLGTEGWDEKTGFGKIDLEAALAGNVDIDTASFTLPKANADLLGETTVQVAITDAANVAKVQFFANDVAIGEIENPTNTPSIIWDTTAVTDGDYTLNVVLLDANGEKIDTVSRNVTVLNNASSGYMFDVKTPAGTTAKSANVMLYEKVDGEDGTYSYKEVWTGLTNAEGVVRVPSHIGTDLKTLQVLVQGTFDAIEGNTWYMYNREVSAIGKVELSSENTVPVNLVTTNKDGEEIPGAEYFISMKDKNGVELTSPKQINNGNAELSPTVYVDKGTYDIFSHFKGDEGTYFLSNLDTTVENSTTLTFDAKDSGEIAVDASEESKVENAVLYLFNKDVTNVFGSSEVLTGKKFFVSPGDYKYIVDAEVKDLDGGENWVYIFESDDNIVSVAKGGQAKAYVGGSLELTKLESDYDSLRRYYTQRGLTYIERDETKNIAHKLDGAFYTAQEFSDAYGNALVGMRRGSIDSADALYQRNIETGATISFGDEESTVTALDFGNLYAKYKVVNTVNDKVILDSYGKNPTNPANRGYYWYAFWVTTSSNITAGIHEVSLTLDPTPLAPEGLSKTIEVDMQDSAIDLQLVDEKGVPTAAFITILSAKKSEDGDYEWESLMGRNTDANKKLSIPTNFAISSEDSANVAIIRYKTATGEFGYLFKEFNNLEELDTTVQIPADMQKVAVNAYEGDELLKGVSTKQWLIKHAVQIGDETVYATANNLQNYKKDSIYLAPGTYTMEGNYVSLPDADLKRDNYYFLNRDVVITNTNDNEVKFNIENLANVNVHADTEGFTDVRGAILYPYSKYSDSFTSTLRVGHRFHVPADLEMDLQVQLGYGDKESTDVIWNYFLSKGTQKFAANDKVDWHVGGQFDASLELEETNFDAGTIELDGHAMFTDNYDNAITSVLVNKTSDYSISEDAQKVYIYKNGEIIEATTDADGSYTIAHGGATEAVTGSLKPVLKVYNADGMKVFEQADLAYYTDLEGIELTNVPVGDYYAELALAASPQGPIKSAKEQGAFTVIGASTPEEDKETVTPSTPEEDKETVTPSTPEEDKETVTPSTPKEDEDDEDDEGRPSSNGGSSSSGGSNSNTSTNNDVTTSPSTPETTETTPEVEETTTTEQVISTEAIQQGPKAELQVGDVKVTIPTKQLAAAAHTVTVEEKDGQLHFSTKANNVEVQFDDYVVLEFTATEFTNASDFAFVRVLEDGTYASVPHTIKDGIVKLKVRKGGTFAVTTEKKTFADAANNGHADYINKLAQRKIITGKTDTSFEPNAVSTRAHFAAIISRALDLSTANNSTFADTKGKWFEQDVQALFEAGIVRGKDATTFDPNSPITRQQAALMLSRVVNLLNIEVPAETNTAGFTDMDRVNPEAQQAVLLLQQLGVFTGKEDGSFDPGAQLTRAQMAKAVYKLLEAAELL